MRNNETETSDLVEIFQQFGIFRNTLSENHNAFVKEQMQKNYDTVTKTYELQGKIYTGTFREDSERKNNEKAYKRECKLATVLASFGFDVILIKEDNNLPGKKPDAIVNGIVVDFKEVEAFYETGVSTNRIGSDYKDAMKKSHTKGVIILLHNFSEKYVTLNMGFEKTRRTNNGIALFFHENTGKFQLIDMEKVRAAHFEQLQQRSTSSASTEPADKTNIPQISEMSSEILTRPVRITVNGKERVCKNGILEGFMNAVKIIDSLAEKIRSIVEENKKLRNRLLHKNSQKSNEMER